MQIESGTGKPFKAGVTSNNRLMSESLVVSSIADASARGDSFVLSSNIIALTTTASFNGVLYFKNTNLGHMLVLDRMCVHSTQVAQWKFYKNTTAGTLVSSGTSFEPPNLNFSSGAKFIGNALRGANALTITDGVFLASIIQNVGMSAFDLRGSFIIDENNSFAIECKPAAAADVSFTAHCYLVAR